MKYKKREERRDNHLDHIGNNKSLLFRIQFSHLFRVRSIRDMVTGIFLPFYTITFNAIPDSFYFNPNTLEKTESSRASGISGFIEPLTRLLNHMITTPPIESYYF